MMKYCLDNNIIDKRVYKDVEFEKAQAQIKTLLDLGSTDAIKSKLKDIIEKEKHISEKEILFQDLLKIYGVGPKKANELINELILGINIF